MNRSYLPGLDGLRCIGAFVVLFSHVEAMKIWFGYPPTWWFPVPGKQGVILFLALSGFLITSLLVAEQRARGIRLVRFYQRRVLRIWPLYFLVAGLSLFVLSRMPMIELFDHPGLHDRITAVDWLCFAFVLPNLASVTLPFAGQVWSIGIEEQFYLVQPLAIKMLNRGAFVAFLIVVVITPELIQALKPVTREVVTLGEVERGLLRRIADGAPYFACMAIGSLVGAMVSHGRMERVSWIYRPVTQMMVLAGITGCLAMARYLGKDTGVDFRLDALLYSLVVLNAAHNPRTLLKLDAAWLRYLGRISYGIYMYHPLCIGAVLLVMHQHFTGWRPGYVSLIVCPVSAALTIGVAAFSFHRFERLFLRLKDRLN